MLEQPPAETGLAGFWHLLKADLLRRLGKPAEAEKEIAAAVKSTPAPPPREVVEVNVPLLIELNTLCRSGQVARGIALEKPLMALWIVRSSPGSTGEPARRRRAVWPRVRAVRPDQGAAQGDLDRAAAGASGAGEKCDRARPETPAGRLGVVGGCLRDRG